MGFRDGEIPDKRIRLRSHHPSIAESALADVLDPQNLIMMLGEGRLELFDGGEVKPHGMSRRRIKHHLPREEVI